MKICRYECANGSLSSVETKVYDILPLNKDMIMNE